MAITPGQVSADPAELDGERVIVPTSIYAPGTLVDAQHDADGAAAGTPPHAGPAAGYSAPPGYSPPPAPSGMPGPGPDYGPPLAPGPNPVYDAPADGPASSPGEHPYGEYAYVIREEEAPAPRPSRPRATGPGVRSPVSEPPPPQEPAEPASAYGPDDPHYGPPSAEWYTSEARAKQRAAEELQPIRGVFEPLPNQGESGQADGTPSLERIKDFYLTAEAFSAENLDRQFHELLERQRQLISAFFTETALQEDPR